MTVVASGGYRGRLVEVTWSDEAPLEGPRDAVLAIIKRSAEIVGTPVGHPEFEVITFDYLRRYYGFTHLAAQVIGSRRFPVTFEYPDGEPSYPEVESGAIG